MHILTINPGSATVKLGLFHIVEEQLVQDLSPSTDTLPEEIGTVVQQFIEHANSIEFVVGVRIVHGGYKFSTTTEITDSVLSELEEMSDLAPLHNPIALKTIHSLKQIDKKIKIFGIFDTSFHANMPTVASQYALPYDVATTHHIKRYGFHGLAHLSMLRQYSAFLNKDPNEATITTIQLGSGCSMCAIRNGSSIDTSMGFSPLEGLVSRTRTGSIDPQSLLYLHKKTGKTLEELLYMFNHESGLKGMSGTDGHMQSLLQQHSQNSSDALALFVYRIQQYIGAYDVVLQRTADLVFGGGISEHAPYIIKSICNNPFLNILLDEEVLQKKHTTTVRLSTDASKRHVYLSQVNEEYEMAKEVYKKL